MGESNRVHGFAWGVYETAPEYRLVTVHRGLSDEQFVEMVESVRALGYDVEVVCPHCERSAFDCYSLTVWRESRLDPPMAYHRCLPQEEARSLQHEYHERGYACTSLYSEIPPDANNFLPGPPCLTCASPLCWFYDRWACEQCEPEKFGGAATDFPADDEAGSHADAWCPF